MSRIGIMGGTFDPLHWAHLIIAEESREKFNLGKVIFIPAGQPPHKLTYPVSDAEHRYAMTLLGTASNPYFEVSRLEIERSGPSYSVDTIREIKGIYGRKTEIYFIVGADEILEIESWHEADQLPKLTRFIVAPRPGFDLTALEQHLPLKFLKSIEILPIAPVDISATNLRTRIATGKTIRYLVPEEVEQYIRKHGLYLE